MSNEEQLKVVLTVKEDLAGFRSFIKEAEKAKKAAEESVKGVNSMVLSMKKLAEYATRVALTLKAFAKTASKAFVSLKNTLVDLGNKAKYAFTLVVAVTSSLGALAINQASDATESLNKLSAVYTETTDLVIKKAKEMSSELGLSYYTIADDFGNIGALLKGFGMDAKTTVTESEKLLRTAYDLASYHNLSFEESITKLRSGLTGETEPLKQIGILILDDQMKDYAASLGLVWKELNNAEKAQLRLNSVIEQASAQGALGDQVKTIKEFAPQVRVLKENFKTLGIELGQNLKRIALPFLKSFNDNFSKIFSESNIEHIKTMTAGVLGLTGMFAGLGMAVAAITSPLTYIIASGFAFYKAWESNILGVQDLFTQLFGNIRIELNDVFRDLALKFNDLRAYVNKNKIESLNTSQEYMLKATLDYKDGKAIGRRNLDRAIYEGGFSNEDRNQLTTLLNNIWSNNNKEGNRFITREEFETFYSKYNEIASKYRDKLEENILKIDESYNNSKDFEIKKYISESFLELIEKTGKYTEEQVKKIMEKVKESLDIEIPTVNSVTSATNGVQMGDNYISLSSQRNDKYLIDQAADKHLEDLKKEKKEREKNIKALKQMTTSIYQVANLMDDSFLKDMAGVGSGISAMVTGLDSFNNSNSNTQKFASVMGIFASGAAMGTSTGGNGTGAAVGSAVGMGVGAGIGAAFGNPMAGAAIGSGIGGMVGGAFGPGDDSDKAAKLAKESAEIQRAAAYEFSRAVDKFKEDVVDKGLGEVFSTITSLKNADADYWEVLKELQTGRRDSDEIVVDNIRQFLPTLTNDEDLLQFIRASIGTANFHWEDGEYVVDTGKGKRGGIDTAGLADAIVKYNDNLLDGFEDTLETILGMTKDTIRQGVQSGFKGGDIENILGGKIETSLINAFTNTKVFNSMTIGMSDIFSKSISDALGKDENLGIELSTEGVDTIEEYIEWLKKYEDVASQEVEKILEQYGILTTEANKLVKDMTSSITKAMNEALKANDFSKFNTSLGQSIYDSVKSSLIKAFAESSTYKKYIDKYMNTEEINKKLEETTSFEDAYKVMQDYLKEVEGQLKKEGLDFNSTSGTSGQSDTNWNSGSYLGKEATQSVVNNYYIYQPDVENLYGDTKEELFDDWDEWQRKQKNEKV